MHLEEPNAVLHPLPGLVLPLDVLGAGYLGVPLRGLAVGYVRHGRSSGLLLRRACAVGLAMRAELRGPP